MKVTIHDVAAKAGVSIKTVSRVMNNEPSVKPTTVDKVSRRTRHQTCQQQTAIGVQQEKNGPQDAT